MSKPAVPHHPALSALEVKSGNAVGDWDVKAV
eukprot:CAMPEP_0177768898 /NCGR_PEP_ID=MMETSP0491_2-20121128/9990_1 /TAXON_ID=63592 /ORGANISM="Tetraselmis chuii, Strain PLY429" /LENGTH=31 /DNA_ID= /DNA_START= /DNA_END= /DNA_ORIENTATION=